MKIGTLPENSRTFLRDLGLLLQIPAFLTIPTLVVIFYYEEYYALTSFLGMAVLSLICGQGLYRSFRKSKKSKRRNALILVALAWFIIPVFGSIPFYFIGNMDGNLVGDATSFSDFSSALFESISGFTSTGLSMLDNPETIPKSLQWWRSFSEWLGGIGVIILAIGVFDFRTKKDVLYEAEAMNWTIEEGQLGQTVKKIWVIYFGFTALSIFSFYLAGMPVWEAINHGLTGIATGGFTITPDSFISYNSAIKWIAVVVMILGAISFQIHYLLLFRADFKKVLRLSEVKVFPVLLVTLIAAVIFLNPAAELVDNVFQTSSALGTCGFNSINTPFMPLPVLFLFIIAMSIGGNATSTTGGLKTRRIIWIIKGIFKNIREVGKEEEKHKDHYLYFNEKKIREEKANEQIKNAANIFMLWIASICIGTFLILISEGELYSFYQILFDVTSALNNVGLSAGLTGDSLTTFTKSVLIGLMWIGRLEIFACLLLIYSIFKTTGKLNPVRRAKHGRTS